MFYLKGKYHHVLFLLTCLCSSTAFSAQQPFNDTGLSIPCYRWMGALLGGYASLYTSSNSHSYTGVDDDIFTYQNRDDGLSAGYIGAFLGVEWRFTPDYFLQTGLEYSYYGSVNFKGSNTVGEEPVTATSYNYRYHFQTQQLVAVAKALASVYHFYHPYLSVGIGAAFNDSSRYTAETAQPGSINLSPLFHGKTQTSFSYTVGVGVDADVVDNVRLGVGYQFTDFGKSSFGSGEVIFNNYSSPVPFSLNNSHTYANQFLAQLSYLG